MADKYAKKIASDLVGHLKYTECLVSTEFPLCGFRSDVFCITKDLMIIDYEIKTSVTDFWNDFKKINKNGLKKHTLFSMGALTNQMIFVMPPNLIPLEDIPQTYGIMYYHGHSFELIRRGLINNPIDPDEYFDGIIEAATAKYTPELLCAFQTKLIQFLRFKVLSTNDKNKDLNSLCNEQEKKITKLVCEIDEMEKENNWC